MIYLSAEIPKYRLRNSIAFLSCCKKCWSNSIFKGKRLFIKKILYLLYMFFKHVSILFPWTEDLSNYIGYTKFLTMLHMFQIIKKVYLPKLRKYITLPWIFFFNLEHSMLCLTGFKIQHRWLHLFWISWCNEESINLAVGDFSVLWNIEKNSTFHWS